MADTKDLKSFEDNTSWEFDSPLAHKKNQPRNCGVGFLRLKIFYFKFLFQYNHFRFLNAKVFR